MTEAELETAFEMMGSRLTKYGNNRSAKCPLAPWTHTKGRDSHPSVTAKAGSISLFKCWACSLSGSVKKLSKLYAEHSGDARAYQFVCTLEGDKANMWGASKKEYGSSWKRKSNLKRVVPVSEDNIKVFLETIPDYAFERGLTRNQVLKWEIGYDALRKRMIFVIRNHMGKLCGVSGRDLTGLQEAKYRHYPGLEKEKVFYGEVAWEKEVRRIYIVEGFFDVLLLRKNFGLNNVFAPMGTSLSFDQMIRIRDWCDEVVFLPDGDAPGLKFAEEQGARILVQLGKQVWIAGVEESPIYSKRDILGQWRPEDYRCKFVERFVSRDPADWIGDDLSVAFSTAGFFKVGSGGVQLEFKNSIHQ